ncbi:unnamed protein product [Commensalibacter communis]|uniref:Uncharacterized protein n=2 Tax=Commensalibacter communis TaxID=2972786 RepID=A0A9W4X6P8_9PROT|nr:hypothetical protein [Commensalibacter communis]CAI3936769.1 unnamed protein product [Commensalibacter communis]CAI3938691.1 unnamed protein product [Commensalibacter communis]CAI3941458.1 unnamed protein product [Commensalibacter communis]CAI3941637.1 unnamed protein product [Commensalibacter communis]CAI3944804.1 unnamed protein product [Commensalibacter communis]
MKNNHWNYRVMKSSVNGLGIYEVYYNEDGSIQGFSHNIVSPRGDSLKELNDDLLLYVKALEKPILDYDQLTKQFQ